MLKFPFKNLRGHKALVVLLPACNENATFRDDDVAFGRVGAHTKKAHGYAEYLHYLSFTGRILIDYYFFILILVDGVGRFPHVVIIILLSEMFPNQQCMLIILCD